jgi:hypothetical protein
VTARPIAAARLNQLRSEVLRGRALVAIREAQDVREETRATLAAIAQRRLADRRRRLPTISAELRSEARR